MLELALVENIQRADLNPLEEAEAYRTLGGRFELSQEEIAVRVGKGRSTVANRMRLLRLPGEVQDLLAWPYVGHFDYQAFPEAMDAQRHHIIHQVVIIGDGIEDGA